MDVQLFWYAFLAFFVIGTALLWRTKHQRSLIIFMIRTRRGLWLLDALAERAPRLWVFFADLSVMISFGGFGAVYVSRYRSLFPLLTVLTILSLLILAPFFDALLIGVLFIALLIASWVVSHLKGRNLHIGAFAIGAVIVGLGIAGFSAAPKTGGLLIPSVTGVFGLPGLLVSSLAQHAIEIVTQPATSVPGVSPLLPGINAQGEIGFTFPGLNVFIPLWSGLLALIILLVSHEFCHGILARVHKIKVTTMGVLTAGPLPIGAFVEPDEKDMDRHPSQEKMHVFAMGSFANLSIAAIATVFLIITAFGLGALVDPTPHGIDVVSAEPGLPAAVLPAQTIITALNGVETLSLEAYLNESGNIQPGQAVTLETTTGTYTLTAIAHPKNASRGYLGFNLQSHYDLRADSASWAWLYGFLIWAATPLYWIFFLNLNVAIVNLLPVAPFDGSKMFEELLKSFGFTPKRRRHVSTWLVRIVLLLLVLNALPLGKLVVH